MCIKKWRERERPTMHNRMTMMMSFWSVGYAHFEILPDDAWHYALQNIHEKKKLFHRHRSEGEKRIKSVSLNDGCEMKNTKIKLIAKMHRNFSFYVYKIFVPFGRFFPLFAMCISSSFLLRLYYVCAKMLCAYTCACRCHAELFFLCILQTTL